MKINLKNILSYSAVLIFSTNVTYAENITIKNEGFTGSEIPGGKGQLQVVAINSDMGASSTIEHKKSQALSLPLTKNPETYLLVTGRAVIKEKDNIYYYTCQKPISLYADDLNNKDNKTLEVSWVSTCPQLQQKNMTCECTYNQTWKTDKQDKK